MDQRDIIALAYGEGALGVGNVLYVDGSPTGGITAQHMWQGYEFDKDGNLMLTGEGYAKLSLIVTETGLANLKRLKKEI